MNAHAFTRFLKAAVASDSAGQAEGKIYGRGSTVPADAATGWAKGALFIKSDGTTGTTLYVNEGSVTSADFNVANDTTAYLPLAGGTMTGDITLTDGEHIITGATSGSKIGGSSSAKLGLWGATPIVQPAHADQAAPGALTSAALTDNGGGAAADGTIAVITNAANAGSADVGPTADAIKECSDQINKLITDLTAVRTFVVQLRSDLVNTGIIKGSA